MECVTNSRVQRTSSHSSSSSSCILRLVCALSAANGSSISRTFGCVAQALALAQGVERQSDVVADFTALFVDDGAGLVGDTAVEKISEWPLVNKANARRGFFLGVGQADIFGNAAHFGFVDPTDREKRFGQLRLRPRQEELT